MNVIFAALFAIAWNIDAAIDLAVVATPAASIPSIVEACGERGIGMMLILSAGFRETGPEGRKLEDRVTQLVRRYGIRLMGPNCLGIMRPDIGLNATFSDSMPEPGRIALVSQSGALCTAILDWAKPRGIGFSSVVSTGIAADLDFGEILPGEPGQEFRQGFLVARGHQRACDCRAIFQRMLEAPRKR